MALIFLAHLPSFCPGLPAAARARRRAWMELTGWASQDALVLAGAKVLHEFFSRPGLVVRVSVYHSKRLNCYEQVPVLAKPPGASYCCLPFLLARLFVLTLLLNPDALDPHVNPYCLVSAHPGPWPM